jgi:hypothetical protein
VVRRGAELWAYLDLCPHQYLPLTWRGPRVLSATPFRVLGRSHFSSRDCIDERERDHLDLCP